MFGLAKGVSSELTKEIPAGQRILPGTGVIHPKVMDRLVANQVRKLRELRRRAGVTGKELAEVVKKTTGKTLAKTTYQEKQSLIYLQI